MSKIKIKKKKKIGFVASGGVAKAGCFHIGVALALARKGFNIRTGLRTESNPPTNSGRDIEVIVGSSAGAFVGALLASGHDIDDIYEAFSTGGSEIFKAFSYADMLHLNWKDTIKNFLLRLPKSIAIRGGSIESMVQGILCGNGFCTTEKLEEYLQRYVMPTNTFSELAAELYLVSTFLDKPGRAIFGPRKLREGEQVNYYTDVHISDAAAASMALPPIFKPYPIEAEGKKFNCFDGEIRHTLSTHIAKDSGCDLIFASYTHQPYHFNEEIGSLIDYGAPSIVVQALYQVIESKIMRSKQLHDLKTTVLDAVVEFFGENDLPAPMRNKLIRKLEEKMEFNRNLDYIFISPDPHHDEALFFEDHFNLTPKKMAKIAEHGFMCAIRTLKDYDFTFSDKSKDNITQFPEQKVAG